MRRVEINTEKLAYGLRRGIGYTGTIFASMEENLRLRCTACGLVSSAIHQYCTRQDIPSALVISTPDLPFDQRNRMQHVLPIVGEGDARTVIDGSYSQFFGYLGLHWAHKDVEAFPKEEIIHFQVSEEELAINWMTKEAIRIQKRIRTARKTSEDLRRNPLAAATIEEFRTSFGEIYKMSSYQPWEAPPHVIEDGIVVAAHIPNDAMEILNK